MKPMRCIGWRVCAGLLLGFALVMCHKASVMAAPQHGIVQPVLPKEDTNRKEALPLPEAGETAHFRYAQDRGGMYRITPTDGSPSYLVSASFLQVTLDSLQLDSFQQAEMLQSYPALMQKMFTKTMAQAYPDATAEYEVPFPTQSFEGTDRTQGLLEQDPAAAPYIRVRLTGGEGEPVEFSVARAVVEHMLANERLTDDQLLQGLRSFPFRLPEAARAGDFARLSAAELARLVQQEPELRRYEFIQMGRLSRDDAEDHSTGTPRQQRKSRVGQRPAATSPAAAPLGVQQRPALAQLPAQIPATRGNGEQLQSDSGAYTPGIGGIFPQVAEPLTRSPVARTEATSAHGVWMPLGLQIVAISLFALGIIALVVSRRTR